MFLNFMFDSSVEQDEFVVVDIDLNVILKKHVIIVDEIFPKHKL